MVKGIMKISLVIIFISMPRSSFAKDYQANSLNRLNHVKILIEIKDEIKHEIRETQIRTDMELALRSHNISILDKDDTTYVTPDYVGLINVLISGFETKFTSGKYSGSIVYSVIIELEQICYLSRDIVIDSDNHDWTSKFLFAITWNKIGGGICPVKEINGLIRQEVMDFTNEFINDFLKANPDHNK